MRFLWTGFGLGLSPVAPGTFGTLLGVAAAWALPNDFVLGGAALVLSIAGAFLARVAEKREGRSDPGSFVLDEVAGMMVAMLFLPRTLPVLVGAFAAFRLFDIWKPPPVRQLEALPDGWGVMADDIVAGVYANVVVLAGLAVL